MSELSLDRREQLLNQGRWLAIGHYVVGVIIGVIGLIFVIYVIVGLAALTGAMPMGPTQPGQPGPSPALFGGMFLGIGLVFLVIFEAIAVVTLYAGTCFSSLRNPTFLLVIQVINLLHQPFGMILGIFGLLWLMNADVKQLFAEEAARRAGE